jgi:hypothetical protein
MSNNPELKTGLIIITLVIATISTFCRLFALVYIGESLIQPMFPNIFPTLDKTSYWCLGLFFGLFVNDFKYNKSTTTEYDLEKTLHRLFCTLVIWAVAYITFKCIN